MTMNPRTRKRRIPSLCLHRATGQAVVRLGGIDTYCGVFRTPAAQEKYDRVVAEWLLTSRPEVPVADRPPSSNITINELILAYWDRHVATYYVKKGDTTSEQDTARLSASSGGSTGPSPPASSAHSRSSPPGNR